MKSISIFLNHSVLIILSLLLLTACGATYQQVEMPRIQKASVAQQDNKVKILHKRVIAHRLKQMLPNIETLTINDKQYVYAEKMWLKGVLDWADAFVYQQIPELGKDQNFPVDYTQTYFELVNSVANLSLRKHQNVDAAVLIGIMIADSKKPWGKIPADQKARSYIVALTEDGGLVYDIYTKQTVDLKSFPNTNNITKILL